MLHDRHACQRRDTQTKKADSPGKPATQIHDGQTECQQPCPEKNDAIEIEPAKNLIQHHLTEPLAFEYGLPQYTVCIVYAERVSAGDRSIFQNVPPRSDMPPEIDVPNLDREIPEEGK